MTILNESGVPDVLPPLHAVGRLAERYPGAFVVVVGTRAEAHLAQTLSAHRSPRVAFLVLDPGGVPAQGRVASRVIEAAAGLRGTELVLLVAGRSAALLGLDAAFEARLISRRLDVPAGAVNPDEPYDGAPGTLSTDLEDRALAALVNLCPRRRTSDLLKNAGRERPREGKPPAKRGGLLDGLLGRGGDEGPRRGRRGPEDFGEPPRQRPVVLLGASSPAGALRELAAEISRVGVEVSGSLPGPGVRGLPAVGEDTVVAPADPGSAAASTAVARGARVVRTLAPVGVDGTARFLQDVAAEAGATANELSRARSVWRDLEPLRNRIRGKRIFFAGDTGLEVPLARFLADAGAVVLEVGAPRLDRRLLAAELQALGPDVDVVEAPDRWGQMGRIDGARPDVVVASPGLRVPLVARGHLCRLPQDFLDAGPYGYEGARRILELFARTFDRAEALDSVNL